MTHVALATNALAGGPRTLVIDSATNACSVALFHKGELIAGEMRMLGRGHAEMLIPMIAALPDKGRAQNIVVSLGPGSFTGVRVGLAAARALAFAWRGKLYGYSSLALVAAIARHLADPVSVGVAMTGGHGEWFVAGFDSQGNELRPLASLPPGAAATASTEGLIAGDQAEALVSARGRGKAVAVWPDARMFNLLPATSLRTDIHPLYGRAPDARLPDGRQPTHPA